MTEVTQADREAANAAQRNAIMRVGSLHEAFAAHRHAATLEGALLMQEAAVEEAEHHFAGSQAARGIRALDPATVCGVGEGR